MVTDCPKFIPNIFNNSKCSSCFKTREEHGDIALDSKSLRRVVKCGYLFIAPRDWDFCNPSVHRTKRWQRRWFVLFSDDQLTWSIDEQPDTIPQGSLDMREILEVKNAEEITENPYSLALTGKATTFIKGINNEDIKSWMSVLNKYGNKIITTGGGKRSLTLPGGFGSGTRFETGVVIGPSRPRFHSVTTTSAATTPSSTYGKSLIGPSGGVGTGALTSRSVYFHLSNVPKGKHFQSFVQASVFASATATPTASSTSTSLSASSTDIVDSAPSPSTSGFGKCFESTDTTDFSTTNSLRGDPDGCGGLETSDGGPLRKGWLLKHTNNDWLKHWFVLQNNTLIYYENSEELNPIGRIEINDQTLIKQFESSRHYGFEVSNKGVAYKLSAITNGMRGIWMKALESSKGSKTSTEQSKPVATPPSPPLKSKKSRWRKKADLKIFDNLKDEFTERERELESLRTTNELRSDTPRMREIMKSQAVQIDNFRTQLSSGFLEIEKLEVFCRTRENEFSESLKCKDDIIQQLRDEMNREISAREKLKLQNKELEKQLDVLTDRLSHMKSLLSDSERKMDMGSINYKELDNHLQSTIMQLKEELELLKHRCNDLTEKLYQSEKTAKTLRTKLGRVKSQSLKDRQIESDVLNKIQDLEEKIGKFDGVSPSSSTETGSAVSPSTSNDGGIINVIMKLNDLDQRVEKVVDSCWFRRGEVEELVGSCQSCKLLEAEVQERDEKLEILEGNLKKLEYEFNIKIKELREFVKEHPAGGHDVNAAAASNNKYQIEIEQLRSLCSKGLEAMENSHRRMVMELEEKHRRELQNLRIEKDNELAEETKATLSALDAMRKNHEMELQREMTKFKDDFLRKFQTGQDLSDLHREHEEELHEIKTEILQLSEKYSQKCVEASKLEETIFLMKSQLNEAKRRILDLEGSDFQSFISSAKKPDQVTALRSRLEQLILSRPVSETSSKTEDQQVAVAKKSRHSIIRSPSCPKLNSRLTVLQ